MNPALILAATGFLFVKTGEKFATSESAGPTLAAFLAQVDAGYEPRVFNDPGKAVEYAAKSKPAAGIVTPGFYLAYAKALGMEPILEVKRTDAPVERYVVVAKKTAGDEPGPVMVTPLAAEQIYVLNVILAGKFGRELRLKPTLDVEGAVFDLVEGGKNAGDAVLMEEATWKVIAADPELGPVTKVVFTSEELPGNLVVRFAGQAAESLKAKLLALPAEARGAIRVEAFQEVDEPRLSRARERFHGK
jgi:hypothetical protein